MRNTSALNIIKSSLSSSPDSEGPMGPFIVYLQLEPLLKKNYSKKRLYAWSPLTSKVHLIWLTVIIFWSRNFSTTAWVKKLLDGSTAFSLKESSILILMTQIQSLLIYTPLVWPRGVPWVQPPTTYIKMTCLKWQIIAVQ